MLFSKEQRIPPPPRTLPRLLSTRTSSSPSSTGPTLDPGVSLARPPNGLFCINNLSILLTLPAYGGSCHRKLKGTCHLSFHIFLLHTNVLSVFICRSPNCKLDSMRSIQLNAHHQLTRLSKNLSITPKNLKPSHNSHKVFVNELLGDKKFRKFEKYRFAMSFVLPSKCFLP